ncbi:uncharacterized protein LOC126229604 [Schistocerca nitens]|uniref:uncharacterized protein LOC126229604 n=1 Tax=Schistocerca nitens TaxID=7011 RepID=UPI0021175B8F|nr:uncharacterized protein LOC126229604 [Schistocerca nitens]
MQRLLPWLVIMVTVSHEMAYVSTQSLSGMAREVSNVHAPDGVHLPNTYLVQQFPWMVDRSKIRQDAQLLQEAQYNFESAPVKREAAPQYNCHQDSQARVVCHQVVAGLEHSYGQQALRQRLFVDVQEEDVHQKNNHKRVVRQDDANHQTGDQQDGHQKDPPQANGAQQQDQPQSNGAQQDQPQSNGAQQDQPQSNGAQQQDLPQQRQADLPLCPEDSSCSCETVSGVVRVDCSSSGLDQLPAGLHPNTTRLSLSGNSLQQLGNDSLAGLHRVMQLYLDKNNITDVHEDAFSGLPNLRVVDFSNNRLSTLPSSVFTSNGKLQKLDLSRNPIHLTGGRMLDSASLYWLNLSWCGISSLPKDSFKGIPQMVMLDLSENQLVVPTALALETLSGLRRLPLVGNPVSCCEVGELRAWVEMRRVSVIRRELSVGPLPTCAQPEGLRGRPWTAAAGHDACVQRLDVAAVVGCVLLGLLLLGLAVAAALLLLRRRRRAARRRRTQSALRREENHLRQDDAGMYEPPPVANPKELGWAGPLAWERRRPSGPRYVASFRSPHPPTVYDDAVGAGRKASARRRDAPESPTYDDAVGTGRTSPLYDYIVGSDGRRSLGAPTSPGEKPPHHSSIPSVLEGCDFYEDA